MTEADNRRRTALLCLVLFLVTVAVYSPVRGFDFLQCDDPDYVTANSHVQSGVSWAGVVWAFANITGEGGTYWHPLTWFSHMLDCQLFGLRPGPHHLVNLAFHAANAVLLFLVLRRMTGAFWRSAVVAALFAWHPLQVESVAWISERKNVLSGFCFFLILLGYHRYARQPNLPRYLLVFFLLCLGLMAKPTLVIVPFLLLVLDFWPLCRFERSAAGRVTSGAAGPPSAAPGQTASATPAARVRPRKAPIRPLPGGLEPSFALLPVHRLLLEKAPLLIPVVFSCVVTILGHQSTHNLPGLKEIPVSLRTANAFVSYLRYAGKAIWPSHLAIWYPYPAGWPAWLVGLSVGFLLIVSALALRWRVSRPWFLAGWLWFIGALVPVIGIVQAARQAMADRFAYLPVIGLFILLVWGLPAGLARWRHRAVALPLIAVASLTAALVLTSIQLQYWRDTVTLCRHALAVTTHNYKIQHILGYTLSSSGEVDEGIALLTEAVREKPDYAEAHNDLGVALARAGKMDEAIAQFTEAVREKPDLVDTHYNLGRALAIRGMTGEAISQFEATLQLAPDHADAHFSLANVLLSQGQTDQAERHYSAALQANPNLMDAYDRMGRLLAAEGRTGEVIEFWQKALRIQPDVPKLLNNLAWLFATYPDARFRNGSEAIRLASRAVELSQRSDGQAMDTLAAAYAEGGRFAEAVETAQAALTLAESAGQKEAAAQVRRRVQLYQSGQPYRE